MASAPIIERVLAEVARLGLPRRRATTADELRRITELSRSALAPAFIAFHAAGAGGVAVLASDTPQQRHVTWFTPEELISRLEDDPVEGLVPFADDLMGNVFYLARSGPVADRVVVFDERHDELVDVAPSFLEFLARLEPRD
jgi:hypothetical protein